MLRHYEIFSSFHTGFISVLIYDSKQCFEVPNLTDTLIL